MKYKVVISKEALSQLEKINNPFKKNIKNKIETLENYNKQTQNIKALEGLFRLRVGNYRIIFDVDDIKNVINILSVLIRKNAYD